MRTQELKEFAEERKLTIRFLKSAYKDIIYREGRKQSIDVDAYEELMPKRCSKNRKRSKFTKKTILKRQLDKVDKCDELIIASGQEIEFLKSKIEAEPDPHKIALYNFEIDDLQNAIGENEMKKKRAELEIDRIIPTSKKKDTSKS